jgi:hypothetical protein
MERKQALAAAAAGTVALGAAVVAAAALGGYSLLGFDGHAPRARATARPIAAEHVRPKVVTKYQDVYEKRVVDTTVAPALTVAPVINAPPVQLVASVPPPPMMTTTTVPPSSPAPEVNHSTRGQSPPSTDDVSDDTPSPTTTIPGATPTTGPGCPRIEYEDNGTWHCDD